MAICFTFTKYLKSEMIIKDLLTNLNRDPPSNLIFIYTHHKYQKTSCSSSKKGKFTTHTYQCYSTIGVSIPIFTQLIPNSFDFSKSPDLFYITVTLNVNMSDSLFD